MNPKQAKSFKCRLLSASALATVLSIASAHAAGLPANGKYVSGTGTLNKAGRSLTVKQSSTTGIIDWNSFSVGSKNSVTFDNGNGATLNRVTGANLSRVAGSLSATGSLYLMNSSGVIVTGTGRVVTGGNFAATSGDISNAAFDDGDTRFKVGKNAVVNRGTITSGGTVTLRGGDVRDTGAISAAAVTLQARNRLAIGGEIAAQNADGSGGTIVATARHIDVTGAANITASGTHGGTVLIGGDVHGGSIASDNFVNHRVATAQTVKIAQGAQISADGSRSSGGNIVIWSNGHTSFEGAVSAKGQTGGGFAEISSHDLLGFTGTANLTSAAGRTGTLLLDPENVVISNSATSGGAVSGGTFTAGADDSVLSVADLEAALASANLIVTTGSSGHQAGDITVLAPITWSSANTLTLDAFHSIAINAAITITGAGGLTLTTNDGGTGGDYSFSGGSVTFTDVAGHQTQGSLTINGESYVLANSVKQLAADIASSPTGNYALSNDYDAINDGTYASSPIATDFLGTFEGLGNTIENLKISDNAGSDIGLFAATGTNSSPATLRDIALTNLSIVALANTANANIGGLVADASDTTFQNVSVTGIMNIGGVSSGQFYTGGLVGNAQNGSITGSSADVSIDAGARATVGGLIGISNNLIISGSRAGGDIIAGVDSEAGGFAGDILSGIVSNSSASGMVAGGGSGNAGGFAGELGGPAFYDYATGDVFEGQGANGFAGGFVGTSSGDIDHSWSSGGVLSAGATQSEEIIEGGFVGALYGTISNSFSTGDVTSGSSTGMMIQGGFSGFMQSGTAISDSYSTGTVTAGRASNASNQIGGFAGFSRGAITKSYSIGAVSVGAAVNSTIQEGGFVGLNDTSGTVDESYSFGKVTGGTGVTVGGFAGQSTNASGLSAEIGDYYNKSANTGAGIGQDNAADNAVFGISSANMFKAKSYTGWSFGTKGGGAGWVIVDSDASLNNKGGAAGGTLPMLLAEYSKTITNAHQLELMNLNVSANYTLGNFVDAGGTAGGDVWGPHGFVHIGGRNFEYGGTFDGQGNVIANLTVKNATDAFGGLFYGLNAGGELENIGLIDVSINDSGANGGSNGALVAGFNDGTISNDYTTGTVIANASSTAGGIAGFNDTTITHSYSTATIVAGVGTSAGGLVAINNGTINQSYATGNVSGGGDEATLGGLAGVNNTGATINESYSSGTVTGAAGSVFGAFIADNTGSVTSSYFDADKNGSAPGVGSGSSSNITGLTAAGMTQVSSFAGWTFGGLRSGADWVIVDADSSLNNAGSVAGGTAPMLLGEYSTNVANAHQLQLIALDLSASYTVTNDINASGTAQNDVWSSAGFVPLGSLSGFSGNFDGEDHSVSGLTITAANNSTVGLFGDATSYATIGDVSLTDVNVSSSAAGSVGGLVGFNQGAVYGVSVAGTVKGTAGDQFIGGVTGTNSGSIFGSQFSGTTLATQDNAGGAAGGLSGSNVGYQAWDSANVTINLTGDLVGAGGLDGINGGLIVNSSASGSVALWDNEGNSGNAAGGLVGINDGGIIKASYATALVNATDGSESFVGGFVGINENGGAITNSYALGSLTGMNAGGFVGLADGGSIQNSYSVGTANGIHANGFVGVLQGTPLFSRDYWDTTTSKIVSGTVKGISGESTAGLQTALRNGFSTATWSIVAGASFPYLNWQFLGGTPEVVSGNMYIGYGMPAVVGVSAQIDAGGLELSPAVDMPSAANGYFYMLLNPSSYDPSNASVLVYGDGAIFADDINTSTISGLQIYGDYLNEVSADSVYSTITNNLAIAAGSDGKSFDAALPNLLITSTGSSFNIDRSIGLLQEVVIDAASGSSVNESAAISADGLLLLGDANFTMTGANQIGTLAVDTDQSVEVTGNALTIGTVDGHNGLHAGGGVLLTTTHGGITITKGLIAATGHPITLDSADGITESGDGFIQTVQLSGSARGAVELNGENAIHDLGAFSGRDSQTFSLVDTKALDIAGDLSGFGTADLTTERHGNGIDINADITVGKLDLVSSGGISEAGAIDATTLLGSSVGSTVLTGSGNTIANLGGFTSGGAFSLTDNHGLDVTGAVTTKASDNLHLTTTGTGGNLAIDAEIVADDIYLVSSGAITEGGKGQIAATKLLGSAVAAANLNSASNTVANLGAFTTGGELKLIDNENLTVTGALNAGSHDVDLTTVGTDHDLAINAVITADTVNLVTTGEATESKSGAIVTDILNVTAATGIDLTSKKNAIQKLGIDKTTTGPNKVSL